MTAPLLFQILERDYVAVDDCFAGLIATTAGPDLERARDVLAAETGRLFKAEADVVHRALARRGAASDGISRLQERQARIRAGLDDMKAGRPERSVLVADAQAVREQFAAYVADARETLFAPLRQAAAAELDGLAVELEAARQREHGNYGV